MFGHCVSVAVFLGRCAKVTCILVSQITKSSMELILSCSPLLNVISSSKMLHSYETQKFLLFTIFVGNWRQLQVLRGQRQEHVWRQRVIPAAKETTNLQFAVK